MWTKIMTDDRDIFRRKTYKLYRLHKNGLKKLKSDNSAVKCFYVINRLTAPMFISPSILFDFHNGPALIWL